MWWFFLMSCLIKLLEQAVSEQLQQGHTYMLTPPRPLHFHWSYLLRDPSRYWLWVCPPAAVHWAGSEAQGAAALDQLPAPHHWRGLHGGGPVFWQAGICGPVSRDFKINFNAEPVGIVAEQKAREKWGYKIARLIQSSADVYACTFRLRLQF